MSFIEGERAIPAGRPRAHRCCVICGGEHLARGLCSHHYHAALHNGTLKNYAPETGKPELPVRPKWEYDIAAGADEDALAEMTERAVRAKKAEIALRDLKRRLAMNKHLSADQLKRIALAQSATEIQEICAEGEQEQAARVAQTESSATAVPKKPRYISVDGFLVEYPE